MSALQREDALTCDVRLVILGPGKGLGATSTTDLSRPASASTHSVGVHSFLKWAALGVAAVVLLIGLWLGIERLRGWWGLRSLTQSLEASGQCIDVAKLEPTNRPVREQNGMVALLALTNQLRSLTNLLDQAPPLGRVIQPGFVAVPQHLERWPIDGGTNTWEKWAPAMEAQRGLLDQIHRALEKPGVDLGVDYQGGFDQVKPTELVTIKDSARLLTLACAWEIRNRRLAVAHIHMLDTLRLAHQLRSEKWIITQVVRRAVLDMAWNAQFSLLQEEGWTDLQLQQQQQAWQRLTPMNDMIQAFEMERAVNFAVFPNMAANSDALRKGLGDPKKMSELLGNHDPDTFLDTTVDAIQPWFWKYVWREQDEVREIQRMTRTLEIGRQASRVGWHEATASTETEFLEQTDRFFSADTSVSKWERFRYPFSTRESSLQYVFRASLVGETQQQLAITALALHRYQKWKGAWPASLNDLSQQDLKGTPRDPLGGGPLSYRMDPAQGFVLYSKGEDGRDDGGDPTPTKEGEVRLNLAKGKDFVWPRVAGRAEAEAFLFKAKGSKN